VQARRELQDLLNRAERLKDWIAATEKLCGRRGSANDNETETTGIVRFRRTKAAVLAGQVATLLKDIGRPMHVSEIVEQLAKRGQPVTAKNPAATVAVALGRRRDQFIKTGPNTFDLVNNEMKVAG